MEDKVPGLRDGYHPTVLLKEVLDALAQPKGGVRDALVLDATLGDGGHAKEILKRGGKVVGIDVDPQALIRVRQRFSDLGFGKERYKLILGNFRNLNILVEQTEPNLKFDGVLFDLGVSKYQLESPQRGFSFAKMGPLDMRMDPSLTVKALDLVNGLNKGELRELFSKLGEEKYSKRLADALVLARSVKRFESTTELSNLIEKTLGRREKIHPATRVFQAIRIAVNDELNALQETLPQSLEALKAGGLVLVISFHSLEDRIVKNTFKFWEHERRGEVLTKKPIVPTEEEIRENPRSRSAKLRIFKKKI